MPDLEITDQGADGPDATAHHLASLLLSEGPEHQPIGLAWLDGRLDGEVELTIDLAPGHRDLTAAVELLRNAARKATELGLDTLHVSFDPGAWFPITVLDASGLRWHSNSRPGSAAINLEHKEATS